MEKEIVPYKESVALAQIGFVQSCWHAYHDLTFPSKEDKHKLETVHNLTSYMESYAHQYVNPVLAPTYSQAFRWFRDNGKVAEIFSQLLPSNKYKWGFKIQGVEGVTDGFFTYEEAELACLKKLIEIAKTK
jgi:hypothetical protein